MPGRWSEEAEEEAGDISQSQILKGVVSHHKFRFYLERYWESVEGLFFEKITLSAVLKMDGNGR